MYVCLDSSYIEHSGLLGSQGLFLFLKSGKFSAIISSSKLSVSSPPPCPHFYDPQTQILVSLMLFRRYLSMSLLFLILFFFPLLSSVWVNNCSVFEFAWPSLHLFCSRTPALNHGSVTLTFSSVTCLLLS